MFAFVCLGVPHKAACDLFQVHTTDFHSHGSGGGWVLTEIERELLLNNTRELLAQFEAERQMVITLQIDKADPGLERRSMSCRSVRPTPRNSSDEAPLQPDLALLCNDGNLQESVGTLMQRLHALALS